MSGKIELTVPPGMTADQVWAAIEKVADSLCRMYSFGYFEPEDIKQEARIFALQVLAKGKYDGIRPLEKYLYIPVRNMLANFKRNHFRRNDSPCAECWAAYAFGDTNGCLDRGTESYCRRFTAWNDWNVAKQNCINMLGLFVIDDDKDDYLVCDQDPADRRQIEEILEIIDGELLPEERKLLLKIRGGDTVPDRKVLQLEDRIFEILRRRGIEL